MDTSKLDKLSRELQDLTGVSLEVKAETPKELEDALVGLKSLISAYKEKYNLSDFLLTLMTGEVPSYELSNGAKRFKLNPDLPRTMFLIDFKSSVTDTTLKVLEHLVDSKPKTLIVPVSSHRLALLKPVARKEAMEDFNRFCNMIVDTLNMEALVSVHISYSNVFTSLSEINKVFQENALALKIGKLFYPEQRIYPNDKLGIGRLIGELPRDVCQRFVREVFGCENPKLLDDETKDVIGKFLGNNLNIAETARQLHMHRNTLILRLEKIEMATGLDLRNFEDALTFRIATMVIRFCSQKSPERT